MFEDLISSMCDFLIPSKEDLDTISKKLENNEKLDCYDIIVLDKIRIINKIIKNKGGRF